LEGAELAARDVLRRCQSGALFGGARVVVVQGIDEMDGKQQNALAKAVGPLPETVAVVLVTGEEGRRRQSGGQGRRGRPPRLHAALRKAIEEKGVAISCQPMKVQEAARWAAVRAKQRGKKLKPATARKLVEQKVGARLGEIEAEIEKLALFVGDAKEIALSDVDEVTPRMLEEDIFRLLDAVGTRSAGRAVSILQGLLSERRERPEMILGMLGQNMRLIWQTKLLLDRGWRTGREVDDETAAMLPQDQAKNALARFRRTPWLARRILPQAEALSWAQLRRAMRALKNCDLAIKGARENVGDTALALELLLVQLCTDLEMPMCERRERSRASAGREGSSR
jgi:DNA polymerase III delta subunit